MRFAVFMEVLGSKVVYTPGVEKHIELQLNRGFEAYLPSNLYFSTSALLSSQEGWGSVSPDIGSKRLMCGDR